MTRDYVPLYHQTLSQVFQAEQSFLHTSLISNSYVCVKQGRLPVKWTAYEGLLYGTYTTQSDV